MYGGRELFDHLRNLEVLQIVYGVAKEANAEIFLVGGCLRDLIAVGAASDMDFAINGPVREIAEETASLLRGAFFPLCRERDCYRVAVKGARMIAEMDFSRFKAAGILDDLGKRDFTINAMAISVGDLFESEIPEILDPSGGREDLAGKVLRLISDDAIDEDPLRILRGFRLAAVFCLSMDEKFLRLARAKRRSLRGVSPERIRTEFFRTLDAGRAHHFIEKMADIGILEEIIPELSSWGEIDQGNKHNFRLLKHSLKTLEHLEALLEYGDESIRPHCEEIEEHLDGRIEHGIDRRAMLKFAALLHDSGKPYCLESREGKVTFYGHDEEGARINRRIARRLKVSRQGGRILAGITRQHMRVLHLSRVESLTVRAMDRFIRDCGDETPEVLVLSLADAWATRDARDVEYTDVEKVAAAILTRYFERGKEERKQLVRGREVMKILGIAEGPEVGRYLELLMEEELDGRINTKKDAVRFLKMAAAGQ